MPKVALSTCHIICILEKSYEVYLAVSIQYMMVVSQVGWSPVSPDRTSNLVTCPTDVRLQEFEAVCRHVDRVSYSTCPFMRLTGLAMAQSTPIRLLKTLPRQLCV
jgi:hypothetical protein